VSALVIQAIDLRRVYRLGAEEVHALRGVSFEIRRNEYVAVMGPSGSGKSTIMNLLGCLDTPSGGEYWLNGQEVVQDIRVGDLLSTGTPAGCALTVPSPLAQRLAALIPEKKKWQLFLAAQARRTEYLSPGDVVEATIRSSDGLLDLGAQRNRIVAEVSDDHEP
jgi:energy-coupling factor transporter ATP-binding protein EcfA2